MADNEVVCQKSARSLMFHCQLTWVAVLNMLME